MLKVLTHPSELVASLGEWLSEILENDHFTLPFNSVFGSNKQPSKPTKSWINLPYLNKNISKCTIYTKQLDLREVYKKTITIER